MTDLDARCGFTRLVSRLACPDCRAGLAFTPAEAPASARGPYGVLRCPCAAYPVVDGVPVLLKGTVAVRSISDARVVGAGPDAADLVRLVEAGRGEEALARLLAFPVCPWPLNLTPAGRAWSQAGPVRRAGLAVRRRTLRRWLRAKDRTAEDWLSLFYHRSPTLFDPFSYFFFRFAQPRHLATLALVPVLPEGRAVLDLACGYGHTLHALTAGAPDGEAPRDAVGLDQNFHQAWVGQHWVAPAARFVCADAERPLPFADGAFGSALCVDAFHYLTDKAAVAGELRRVTAGGPVVLARVGNAGVEPNEGEELAPEAYAALFELRPSRWFAEDALVDAYLAGETPDLTVPTDIAALVGTKWLYGVAAESEAAFPPGGPTGARLHTAGRLAPNPLYVAQPAGTAVGLRFRFPSPWYAFENARMAEYHVPTAALDAEALGDLAAGRRTDLLARLADQFALIGLPARYARAQGRPWPVRAHRALTFAAARLRRRHAG